MTRLLAVGRRGLWVVSVNLLVLLALIVVVESIFGEWLSRDEDISTLSVRPNTLDIRESPLYPPGKKIIYSRDRYGFRTGAGDASKVDVLAVGGSTTNERWIDDADLWTVQLQHLLAERACKLIIANTGVDGYSTLAHIASFNQWFNRIPGLKPRFVLVYAGVNDVGLDPSAPPPGNPQKYPSRWRRVEHYIAARSAIRRLYITLRGWWEARQAGLAHGEVPIAPSSTWQPAVLPANFAALSAAKSAAYRQRLERLNALIHDFGAIPVYITQPRIDGREVDGNWQQVVGSDGAAGSAYLLALDRTTLKFCRDTGEACVDLAGEIKFAPGDFYDPTHNTLAGSNRIAQFLATALAPILCPEIQSGSNTLR